VVDVRGMGLMLAMDLNSAELAKRVVAKMLERHILINRTSETVLRFLPPYIMGREHVDMAISALNDILSEEGAGAPSMAAAHQNTGGPRNG
jgi:acetylornithine/N-succinyldiaminopimelate aminotransferase